MPPYTIEQIKNEVSQASEEDNATAPLGRRLQVCLCSAAMRTGGRLADPI